MDNILSTKLYEGEMTVGMSTFMGTDSYGYNNMWNTTGSLNPENQDIVRIIWFYDGFQPGNIIIEFSINIIGLGVIEFDGIKIDFTIEKNIHFIDKGSVYAVSVLGYETNPFNDVGEITTVKINYKLI